MIIWPQGVINDIARRRCVIFLGSGISANSTNVAGLRPKTWSVLLNDLLNIVGNNPIKTEVKKLLKKDDYLTACEIVKKKLGVNAFNSYLQGEFVGQGFQPASIHDAIFRLDSRIVITPNFDKIYENHASHASNGSIIVKNYYDADVAKALRAGYPIIIKMHGTIDTPDKMIFSRKDYSNARINNENFYDALSALTLTHTFLFLGCGFNDPDVRLVLENMFIKHNFLPHYFVVPKKALTISHKEIINDTMGIDIIEYDSTGNHIQLEISLNDLVSKVDIKRIEIQNNMNW